MTVIEIWLNYVLGALNKLKLFKSNLKSELYLTGLKGTKVFKVDRHKEKIFKKKDRIDKPSLILDANNRGEVILLEPNSNDLCCYNSNFEEVSRIYGLEETPKECKPSPP